ncbi:MULTISPECIES: lipopolysaccharide biosynthesis protein [Sphingobacterium]|uniref:Lipopolysaccharide biosynthesis protein n=1 Tax=Sphingobacterium populi TaxID=1812824 RepID=A0ABW5UAV9_9SPHI|nr:polysaccharide biosynthesis C-terminal domain-containing protein [Sphingobacterium sp. CFCC 11742]
MSGIKRLVSDTIIYGFTTIVSRLLNFILTPIFTERLKSVAVYGVFTHLYACISLLNALLAFGMETTFFRYLQKVAPEEKGKVYDQAFLITLFTSIVVGLLIYFNQVQIATWLSQGGIVADYVVYVQMLLGVLITDALAVVPFAKLRAEGRPIRYAMLKVMNVLITLSCNLAFLYLFPTLMAQSEFWNSLLGGWFRPDWILGNIFLANLIASASTLLFLLPQLMALRIRLDTVLTKSMLGYSFPILIANLSFVINEFLDKMIFPYLLPGAQGAQDLGIYGAVSKLAIFISLFVTAFRLGAEPFFFSYAKNENAKKTYADIMHYFVLFLVIGMLGICANLDWLKNFLRSDDPVEQARFWSGLFVIPVLLFNYVLLGIYMNLSVWYKLTDQTRYGLYISVIGAIITVVLNIILIPRYSYVGAALCTTFTYICMVLLSYFWGQKNYPIPYTVGKISLYLLSAILLSAIMQGPLNSNFWWCNFLLVVYVAAIGVSEKAMIMRLWKGAAKASNQPSK